MRFFLLSLISLTLHSGCSKDVPRVNSGDTSVGVVYGKDGRQNPNATQPHLKDAFAATVALFRRPDLQASGKHYHSISSPTYGASNNLCTGQRFAQEKSPAFCTGLLITPDRVLTAAHCIPDDTVCAHVKFVFDFTNSASLIANKNIFSCKKIVRRTFVLDGMDFMIVQLQQKVKNRNPIPAGDSDLVKLNDPVSVVGFPGGISMKHIRGGKIRSIHQDHFVGTLDTFLGASGAPVFSDVDGAFIGMVIRGANDYKYNPIKKCNEINVCQESACRGEDILPINLIKHFFEAGQGPNKEVIPEWE